MKDRRFALLVVALAALAIAARLAVMVPRIGTEADDPDHYLTLAKSLAEGRGFTLSKKPTAYRPPLYPILLAPLVGSLEPIRVVPQVWGPLAIYPFPAAIAGLHAVLAAAAVGWTMLAARRWGLPPIAIAASGLVVAFDPLLIVLSRSVMTETLATALMAWALAASARPGLRGEAETGVAFGLAALCRPSTLACAAIAIVFLTSSGGRMKRGLAAAVMAGTILVALAPWAIRNKLALGEFVWGTTHRGYTLALANNPEYYRDVLDGPPGAVWSEAEQRGWAERVARETAGLSEPEADRGLARDGWAMLRDRPRDFARASLARLARFWEVMPSAAVYGRAIRLASAAWYAPIFLLAALGLVRRDSRRWPRSCAPALILGLSCVHAIFWTDMRMRAPLVSAIAILAAAGLGGVTKKGADFPESA